MKANFYTLTGYNLKDKNKEVSTSMEDYLEMMYRLKIKKDSIHIKDIATNLNVRPSSASKMCTRLKEKNLITCKKYSEIKLTKKGLNYGKYFYQRHNTLVTFFKILNKDSYSLKQVEKVEHFLDRKTIKNIKKLILLIQDFLYHRPIK